MGSDMERDDEEEEESVSEILRDRFRLSTISIAEAEGKKNGMQISEPIVACVSDLAFKYAPHRNDHLAASLRSISNELKAKEPQSERKRKKNTRKEDKSNADVHYIADP
ncbi:Hypothetical predicted protein [Olea europaea subsp. europaea]|uniref:Uncharacterized protein n=1 Tax=Olea europaea subsp. europaea TaxID=158383 RepID=A0A8S0UBB9_OLEEU|nr:Hypothetical predicted protein [Olea europaea subsp. europaea]